MKTKNKIIFLSLLTISFFAFAFAFSFASPQKAQAQCGGGQFLVGNGCGGYCLADACGIITCELCATPTPAPTDAPTPTAPPPTSTPPPSGGGGCSVGAYCAGTTCTGCGTGLDYYLASDCTCSVAVPVSGNFCQQSCPPTPTPAPSCTVGGYCGGTTCTGCGTGIDYYFASDCSCSVSVPVSGNFCQGACSTPTPTAAPTPACTNVDTLYCSGSSICVQYSGSCTHRCDACPNGGTCAGSGGSTGCTNGVPSATPTPTGTNRRATAVQTCSADGTTINTVSSNACVASCPPLPTAPPIGGGGIPAPCLGTDPFSACSGGACISIAACGFSSCFSNAECGAIIPTPTPVPTTITGNVFLDTNQNGVRDAGESEIASQITIGVQGAGATTASYPTLGSYRIAAASGGNLTAGNYTVSYSIPSGFTSTEPLGTLPSFSVQSGNTCSVGNSKNASCSSGNILNLDFGVTTVNSWIQSIGNDIRVDSGFSNNIPASASCGSYSSIAGGGGTPGIIYSGASSSSFGQGSASLTNWVAGGNSYPESYTPIRPGLMRTSYSYLLSVAKQAVIVPTDISTYCGAGGINFCGLPADLPNGLYIANGNLNLAQASYTFPTNKNFVILVDGDLTLKGKVLVPSGSTATFSTSGNIIVDRGVGESSSSSTVSDVEGFYSADRNFIVDGANNCGVGADLRLNIAGAVVINASLTGGIFQNNRSLCAGNDQCPVFSVKERPDFVLNAPDFIKHPSYVWQETAP